MPLRLDSEVTFNTDDIPSPSNSASLKIFVFTYPRSGSTWLCNSLARHSEITFYGEIMGRRNWPEGDKRFGGLLPPEYSDFRYRHDHADDTFELLFARQRETPSAAVKLMLLLPDHVIQAAGKVADRTILLTRDNQLASYASEKLAKITGQGVVRGNAKVISKPVPFEEDGFERYRKTLRKSSEREAKLPEDALRVTYHQLRTEGFGRIAKHIGVDHLPTPVTKKRGSDDVISRFSNPNEVWAYLKQHGLEHWASEA